ncbi:hypothetical protein GCM10009548_11560 [Streptomyces malaysiensis subsp. malaysiensis]|uniref:Uncharacterized protein n=1 Tax=Streptomyces malaysiensis TaxID=92644 RepID=A0ABX6W7E2_STRMQ|nr:MULTISPECIES: hypothetical protein [Streptomyces]QPI57382.1 hypothetical protein I1A49_22915 [Streptomyces solisilvae]UHH18934.1 hypothetical protein LUV23_23100 [Streptomyces sp. HNM0561]
MIRLRIQRATWPGRALILTDTPRPDCRNCDGEGGTEYDYGDYETGEYAGTDWEPCPCWNENRRWTLLPLPHLPRWLRRRDTSRDPWATSGYSDEPPF